MAQSPPKYLVSRTPEASQLVLELFQVDRIATFVLYPSKQPGKVLCNEVSHQTCKKDHNRR